MREGGREGLADRKVGNVGVQRMRYCKNNSIYFAMPKMEDLLVATGYTDSPSVRTTHVPTRRYIPR